MTPYEKADLFRSLIDSASNITMDYVSVLFAFLVAAYLVAPHLNRAMSGIIIGLFSLFSAIMIFSVNRTLATTTGLVNEIRQQAANGDMMFSWHPVVTEPANFLALTTPVVSSLLVASAISGIVFFFYARKRKLGDGLLSLGQRE